MRNGDGYECHQCFGRKKLEGIASAMETHGENRFDFAIHDFQSPLFVVKNHGNIS